MFSEIAYTGVCKGARIYVTVPLNYDPSFAMIKFRSPLDMKIVNASASTSSGAFILRPKISTNIDILSMHNPPLYFRSTIQHPLVTTHPLQ